MKRYATADLRNVALISHGGHGTTSLGEALLFTSGTVNRLGSVDAGNSVLDFQEEEKERKSSISAGLAYLEYRKTKVNLIDLPGLADFVGDIDGGLRASDSAILVVSAVDGVEVRTERMWTAAEKLDMPVAIFVNKMDRERASFQRTLDDIKATLGITPVPLTVPIGEETGFRGVIDVIAQKAYFYPMDGSANIEAGEIPGDMADQIEEMRAELVEEIAGTDEELMERYFDEGDLDTETLTKALVPAVRSRLVVPLFAGSATKNAGITPVLDLLVNIFPAPGILGAPTGHRPGTEDEVRFEATDAAPFSALVFKSVADKYTGQLSIFRIFSGKIDADSSVYNSTKETHERFGSLLCMRGRETETVDGAACGDIVAVAKLKDTHSGDTLCASEAKIVYPRLVQPPPAMTLAIVATRQGDEDKIYQGLAKLTEEDPALMLRRDPASGTLLSGMGQLHIDATLKRLERKFNVPAATESPRIAYRETIKGTVPDVRYRHKKQTGGKGQFAECTITLSPAERGAGYVFEDAIVGGVIPRQFIPAVDKGISETMARGIIAGYPVVDVHVKLHDGKFHDVDSSEMAFKIAGRMAFKNAFKDAKAKAVLLEPIMSMEITVPEEAMGDVMGDLSSRRGRPMGMEAKGKYQVIKAQAPEAEVLRYSPDLRSMTGGRGDFTMHFDHYEEVPRDVAEKIMAKFEDDTED